MSKTIYICSNKYFEIEENIVYFDFIHDKKCIEARHESNNFFLQKWEANYFFFFGLTNKHFFKSQFKKQTFFLQNLVTPPYFANGPPLKRSIETSSMIGYWSLHGKIS